MDRSITHGVIDLIEPCREAVTPSGGKGVRWRPYTTLIPEPLVPIGDEHSILEIVLRQLAGSGFTKATIAIGPALTIADRLPEHFLLMNGDILTDHDRANEELPALNADLLGQT